MKYSKTLDGASKVMRKCIDYILSLGIISVMTSLVIMIRWIIPVKKQTNRKGRIAVSLARFREAPDVFLQKKQYLEDYENVYVMPTFDRTIILCIGDNRQQKIYRFGKKIILVSIPLKRIAILQNILPNTESAVRYIISLFIQFFILWKRDVDVLLAISPLNRMWNFVMLRWLLAPKLIVQVRGNFDLTRKAGEKLRSGFSFFHFVNIGYLLRYKLMAELFYRTSDCVIGYNINNMNSALSNGAHPEKTYLSRVKVNKAILESKETEFRGLCGENKFDFTISMWSRLEKEKYTQIALEGCIPFLQKNPLARFVIIGDGSQRQSMQDIAKKNDIKRQVFFCGWQEAAFIRHVAMKSDAVLVPYGGSSLIEAAFLKCSVIAFDIEWHNELIFDGETGWLVDYHFPDAISQVLEIIMMDPIHAKKMGEKLQYTAMHMFNNDKIFEKEQKILCSYFLCCRRKAAQPPTADARGGHGFALPEH